MLIKERLALLKAGYGKDEINAMIEEEKQQPTEENKAEDKPADFTTLITALADEVKSLKKAVQTENIENSSMNNESSADNIDKILQSIINPTTKKEENK